MLKVLGTIILIVGYILVEVQLNPDDDGFFCNAKIYTYVCALALKAHIMSMGYVIGFVYWTRIIFRRYGKSEANFNVVFDQFSHRIYIISGLGLMVFRSLYRSYRQVFPKSQVHMPDNVYATSNNGIEINTRQNIESSSHPGWENQPYTKNESAPQPSVHEISPTPAERVCF